MRAAELVRRAHQDVAADLGDVDRLVRRVVHRVDPRDRAGLARQRADALRVCDRAGRVRGERERDDARPVTELPLEVVVVDREPVGRLDDAARSGPCPQRARPTARHRRRGRAASSGSRRPASKSRAAVRGSAKSSVVMFMPNEISSGVRAEEPTSVVLRAREDRLDRAAGGIRARRGCRTPRATRSRSPARPRPGPACRRARRRTRSPIWSDENRSRAASTAKLVGSCRALPSQDPGQHGEVDVAARHDADHLPSSGRRPVSAAATRSAPAPSAITRVRSAISPHGRRHLGERTSRSASVEQLRRVLPHPRDQLAAARPVDERRLVLDARSARRAASVAATGAPVSGSAE